MCAQLIHNVFEARYRIHRIFHMLDMSWLNHQGAPGRQTLPIRHDTVTVSKKHVHSVMLSSEIRQVCLHTLICVGYMFGIVSKHVPHTLEIRFDIISTYFEL